MLLFKISVILVFAVSAILCSSVISPKYSYGGKMTNDIAKNARLAYYPLNFFVRVRFSESLFLADNYLFGDPISNIIRYYKENDINYYTRIRKENSKHVHKEPYSFERIDTGLCVGISFHYRRIKFLACCFITINILV